MKVIINAKGISREAINHSLKPTKNNIVKNTRTIVVIAVFKRLS
jgi:hypothetical protein